MRISIFVRIVLSSRPHSPLFCTRPASSRPSRPQIFSFIFIPHCSTYTSSPLLTMADDTNTAEMASNGASDVPNDIGTITAETLSLAQYYNNSSKVDPKEKLSYISCCCVTSATSRLTQLPRFSQVTRHLSCIPKIS